MKYISHSKVYHKCILGNMFDMLVVLLCFS